MFEWLDVRWVVPLVTLSWFVIGLKFQLSAKDITKVKEDTDKEFEITAETNKRYVLELVSDCRSELYKSLEATEEALLRQIERNRDTIENTKTAQALLFQDYERTKLDLGKLDKTVNEIQKEVHELSALAREILTELKNKPNS